MRSERATLRKSKYVLKILANLSLDTLTKKVLIKKSVFAGQASHYTYVIFLKINIY